MLGDLPFFPFLPFFFPPPSPSPPGGAFAAAPSAFFPPAAVAGAPPSSSLSWRARLAAGLRLRLRLREREGEGERLRRFFCVGGGLRLRRAPEPRRGGERLRLYDRLRDRL